MCMIFNNLPSTSDVNFYIIFFNVYQVIFKYIWITLKSIL